MPAPRNDSGATIPARGQQRPAPLAAPAVAPLDRLSASLPPPLRGAPAVAVLSWLGALAIACVVLLSLAVRSAKAVEILEEDDAEPAASATASSAPHASSSAAVTAEPPKKPRASETALAEARAGGAETLAQLAQKFPDDGEVQRALFLVQAADKKTYSAALRTARRMLDAEPASGGDPEVRTALLAIANGPTDTAAVALDLMASEMGERGVELLFEVAGGSVLLSKTKAAALLKDADVRRHATPALLVAFDLLEARPCARKAFIARAKTDGDARSLALLKPLVAACSGGGGGLRNFFRGGGGGDCLRCFTPAEREEIQGAIAAIEARTGGDAGAPAKGE